MKEMGWKPEVNFDESLEKMVRFTLENEQWP